MSNHIINEKKPLNDWKKAVEYKAVIYDIIVVLLATATFVAICQ